MRLPDPLRLPERQRVPGLPVALIDRLRSVPRWGWFFIVMLVLPLTILPLGSLARFTTSSPTYCLSCHATGDTPNRGVKSLVHPEFSQVTCVDCHAKTGQLVFEGYVKGYMAEPERVVENCMRCHKKMTQTNEEEGFKYNFLEIRVTHQNHLQRGANCTTCHANVAHDLAVPQTNRPKMQSCNACHAVTDTCTKCHTKNLPTAPPPLPAPASAGMLGDGRVYYLRTCAGCHGPKGENVEQANLHSQEVLDRFGDSKIETIIADGHGVMPGFSLQHGGPLNKEQIRSIVGYLKTEALGTSTPNASAVYDRNCLACHGQDGDKVSGVSFKSADFWTGRSLPFVYLSVDHGKGGMPAFGKDNGGRLTRSEIESVLAYLQGLGGVKAASTGEGDKLYSQSCAGCHGANASQVPSAKLKSKLYFADHKIEDLVKTTAEGKGGMPGMGKSKGGALTDDQIKAILDYLRSQAE